MTKNDAVKSAAAVIMIAAAAVSLYAYLKDARSDDAHRDLLYVCLDHDELHPFIYNVNDLAKLMQQRKDLHCPDCNSPETRAAKECPKCDGPLVLGPHGITSATCPHCNAELRTGRIDFFHAGPH